MRPPIALLVPLISACAPAAVEAEDPRLTELVDWTWEMMHDWYVPGAAIAIVEDGALRHVQGLGFRDADRTLLVTPDTAFRIGSLTKGFTGMLAAQAATDGLLDLDAPAREALGDLEMEPPDSLGDFSLLQLLSHHSGLQSGGLPNDCDTDPDGDGRILAERVPEWSAWYPTGELFLYSNEGFALSGYALERAVGRDYVDHVESALFGPAGMETATFDRDEASARAWALGFSIDNQTGQTVSTHDLYERNCRGSYPAGGVVATATDLGRWMEVLLAQGDPVISDEAWELMSTRGWYSSSASHYGFGLQFTTWRDMPVITHTGAVSGYNAMLWVMPDQGFGVAVLVNSDHTTTSPPEPWTKPTQLITLHAIETFLALDHEEVESSVRPVEEWSRFEGHYVSTDGQGIATVRLDGEDLWFLTEADGGQELLYPYSASRFQYPYLSSTSGVTYWRDVEFLDGDDDAVDWMVSRAGVWRRAADLGASEPSVW